MKYKLIIGSNRGLGLALTKTYLDKGFTVIAVSKNTSNLDNIKLNTNNLHVIKYDITDFGNINSLLEYISKFNKIDVIICSAIVSPDSLSNQDNSILINTVNTNLLAPINLIKNLSNFFDESRIMLVSSGLANFPLNNLSSYCISKAGLKMAWQCLNLEYNPTKAIFGYIIPGIFDTDMQKSLRESNSDELACKEMFTQFHQDKKLREPIYVADFIYRIVEFSNDGSFSSQEWDIDKHDKLTLK
jgi:short-subunit dehydrogenase involved in D-alanine esterification of teichoic acids